jgi:hypothetical protein
VKRPLAGLPAAALLAAAVLCGPAAGAPAASAEPAGPRAIWTWEGESYAMLESEGMAAQGIAFLKAKGIGTVYLYADAWRGRNLIASQPERYRRLLRRMHASGFKVYALLGSGYLNTERYVLPRHREEALAMLQRVLDYNRAAAPEERFDGVNLDIEPHILAEWSSRKMELLAGFLDMSEALMRSKAQSGQALPIGPAIPFWLDGIQLEWKGRRKPVSQHVQDLYDYVALMDYRDHADGGDGLVSHAMDELAYGESIGRPVLIGIETMPNEIKKVSFHHLREADLERELAATSRSVGGMRSFGGYVVHHYAAYRRWLGLD